MKGAENVMLKMKKIKVRAGDKDRGRSQLVKCAITNEIYHCQQKRQLTLTLPMGN